MVTRRLALADQEEAVLLFGQHDRNLKEIERRFNVQIFVRPSDRIDEGGLTLAVRGRRFARRHAVPPDGTAILTPLALAIIYFVIPASTGRPVFSHFLSMLGFWLLFFLYPLNGTHHYVYSVIPMAAQLTAIVASALLGVTVVIVRDDLIGLGIDAKHSNEDAIAPFDEWITRYGDRIGLLGGIDVDILCQQSPQDIVNDVVERGGRFRRLGQRAQPAMDDDEGVALVGHALDTRSQRGGLAFVLDPAIGLGAGLKGLTGITDRVRAGLSRTAQNRLHRAGVTARCHHIASLAEQPAQGDAFLIKLAIGRYARAAEDCNND